MMTAAHDTTTLLWLGFRTTVILSVVSGAVALVLGTIAAGMRVSPVPLLRGIGAVYVALIRNTPSTLLFFFTAFILPELGVHFSYFAFAWIALSIYYGSFFCEVVRSGISSVAAGQAEAARALGLNFTMTLANVILPQAVRTVIPPLINTFIAVVRTSAIAGAFGVAELFAITSRLTNEESQSVLLILFIVALLYLSITIPISLLAEAIERKTAFAR
jgi:glutamate transport system permease protein